jgi:hypothetical protein
MFRLVTYQTSSVFSGLYKLDMNPSLKHCFDLLHTKSPPPRLPSSKLPEVVDVQPTCTYCRSLPQASHPSSLSDASTTQGGDILL